MSIPSAHDLLADDLAWQLSASGGFTGHILATREVSIPGARFDVVAVDTVSSPLAVAFEVKVTLAGVKEWVRKRGWEKAWENGTSAALAIPHTLNIHGVELPNGVVAAKKTGRGDWDVRFAWNRSWTPSAQLLGGFARSIRRDVYRAGYIGAFGNSVSRAIHRAGEAAAE